MINRIIFDIQKGMSDKKKHRRRYSLEISESFDKEKEEEKIQNVEEQKDLEKVEVEVNDNTKLKKIVRKVGMITAFLALIIREILSYV